MQQFIENLSQRAGTCILLSVTLFLAANLIGRGLLNALFRMHKSKSMVRKLYDKYSFWEKIRLLHVEQHCEHAVKFCRGLLLFHRMSSPVFGVYLLVVFVYMVDIIPASALVWFSLGRILVFDLPVFLIDSALSRPFIRTRNRPQKYSFEKYHNSGNYTNLL